MTTQRPLLVALTVFALSAVVAMAADLQLSRIDRSDVLNHLSVKGERAAAELERDLAARANDLNAVRRAFIGATALTLRAGLVESRQTVASLSWECRNDRRRAARSSG